MKKAKSKSNNQDNEGAGTTSAMPLITLICVGLFMSYIAFTGFRAGFRSLDDLIKHTGAITDKGEITLEYGKMGERTYQDHFFINLAGLDYRLTSYNMDERYGDLDRALSIGDEVTVYYAEGHDLYQIEKDGTIVLDISDAGWRGKILGGLMAGGAIFVFVYGIRGHRRKWTNIK